MTRQQRLLLDTVLLGVVGALSAQLFILMLKVAKLLFLQLLAGYQPPGLPSEGGTLQQVIGPHGLWLIPVATTLGGLISGIIVYSLAPEAEGHGTDAAIKAFHWAAGFIRARVPPIKLLASAITIGSGGAAGREGPTALISAGIGSIYGSLTHRSNADRRLLVLIGVASGLAAIFRSPVGTAFFAIEVLYSDMEFDTRALLYTMIGSVIAYAVNGLFVGFQPLFELPATVAPPSFGDYGLYALLGLVAGLVATVFPTIFYGVRDLFSALRIPPHFKPAIGGLGLGLMALALPQVLGGGYGWVQEAIDGRLSTTLLGILVIGQMLALTLTVASGGSGGIFGPSLFVGGMLGGFMAQLLGQPPAGFVIVGMAALFAGAARVPIATVLMVTEMTGGYHLLVAAALAVMLSYLIQTTLSARLKYKSLYENQVPARADSPAHHAEQVEAVIRLLGKRSLTLPGNISHLDITALLASGIPVDLSKTERLVLGTLNPSSSYVGQTVSSCFPFANPGDVELVAVFRQDQTFLPHGELVLEANDRLLLIVTPAAWEELAHHFLPLPTGKMPAGARDRV